MSIGNSIFIGCMSSQYKTLNEGDYFVCLSRLLMHLQQTHIEALLSRLNTVA